MRIWSSTAHFEVDNKMQSDLFSTTQMTKLSMITDKFFVSFHHLYASLPTIFIIHIHLKTMITSDIQDSLSLWC